MKLIDWQKDHRHLGIVSLVLSLLLVVRRIFLVPFSFWSFLMFLFWPIVGMFIFFMYLNSDGPTLSPQEVLYLVLVFYCGIYYLIASIMLLINPIGIGNASLLLLMNILISAVGFFGFYLYAN